MGCGGRAGAGQASLCPAPASPAPALLLSASINQPKYLLLCKQRPTGFMELQVTMCLSPSPSHPRAAPLRVPGRGCTYPHWLAWDACPSGPSVGVLVPSRLACALACTRGLQTCVSPSPPLPCRGNDSGSIVGTQHGAGGGPARGRWDLTLLSQSADPSPALSPALGTCGTRLHPAFHEHLLSRMSISLLFLPFFLFLLRQMELFIISAKKLLTGVCGGARIGPPLIFMLNN